MKHPKGFTLVEMALYVGICSVVLFSLSTLFATLVSSRVKNQIITEVNQQGAFVMNTITYAVRNGVSIQSPASGSASSTLIITSSNPAINPSIIYGSSSRVVIRESTSTEIFLTNTRVIVNSLLFENVSSSTTDTVIRVSFTISGNTNSTKQEFNYSKTFTGSATLRQ
ncbi:MAG: hypothetical protein RI935_618 [Candidatus Parcubacteria bacterium]|jgi:hypothetical protein